MLTPMVKKTKVAIILFYLILFVGLALYDQKLVPEMAQEIATPQPKIIDPDNAWVAFLGFESPEGISPYLRGEEKIKRLEYFTQDVQDRHTIAAARRLQTGNSFQGQRASCLHK